MAWAATQLSASGSPGSKKLQPGLPQIFKDVNEVDQNGHPGAVAGGFGLDGLDLGPVAVHEGDPVTLVPGVAALCPGGPGRDDGADVLGDRSGQPLAGRRGGGPGRASPGGSLPEAAMMSAAVRGTGTQS